MKTKQFRWGMTWNHLYCSFAARERTMAGERKHKQTYGAKFHSSMLRSIVFRFITAFVTKIAKDTLVLFPLLSCFRLLSTFLFAVGVEDCVRALNLRGPLSFSRSSILITLTACYGHWCVIKWIGSELALRFFFYAIPFPSNGRRLYMELVHLNSNINNMYNLFAAGI